MTTIKLYDADNSENYLEFFNAEDDQKMTVDISLYDIGEIHSFSLSEEDAVILIKYLKEQFSLA